MNRDQLIGAIALSLGQYFKCDAASGLTAADGILKIIQAAQGMNAGPAAPQTSSQMLDLAGTIKDLQAEVTRLRAGAAAPQTAPSQPGSGGA